MIAFLFILNQKLYVEEQIGKTIVGPGLLNFIQNQKGYVSTDCVSFDGFDRY